MSVGTCGMFLQPYAYQHYNAASESRNHGVRKVHLTIPSSTDLILSLLSGGA